MHAQFIYRHRTINILTKTNVQKNNLPLCVISGKNSCVFDITQMELGGCAAMMSSSIQYTKRSFTENIITRNSFIFTRRMSTLNWVCCVWDIVVYDSALSNDALLKIRSNAFWLVAFYKSCLLLVLDCHVIDKCFKIIVWNSSSSFN